MVVRVGSTPSGGADRAQPRQDRGLLLHRGYGFHEQRLADLVTDDFHEGTERRLDVGGVVAPAVGAKELRQAAPCASDRAATRAWLVCSIPNGST